MKSVKKYPFYIWGAVILVFLMSEIPGSKVAAASGTAYVAKATPYYKHPVTGKIEDPGNNEGLGQSMTESVLYKKALIEEMSDGSLYATVRIFLTDNINNVKIWTQKKGGTSWKKATAKIMQENMGGEYCSDYRFAIPEKTAVMKMSFYVTPMGRDVIFFFRFSGWKKGTADFVTSLRSSSSVKKSGDAKAKQNTKNAKQTSGGTKSASPKQTAEAREVVNGKRSEKKENRSDNVSSGTPEDENETGSQTDSYLSGEELVENAQGLTISDDEVLADSGETGQDSVSSENGTSEVSDKEESTLEQAQPAKMIISWVLVLQCILIITVPSLLILAAMALFLQWMRKA